MQTAKKRVNSILKQSNTDAILIMNTTSKDPNFTYLTGIYDGLFEDGIVVADRKSIVLYPSALEYEIAKKSALPGIEITKKGGRIRGGFALKGIESIMGKTLYKRSLGINGSLFPVEVYNALVKMKYPPSNIVDCTRELNNARSIKDIEEISKIRKAAIITKRAIAKVRLMLRSGISEIEVANKIAEQFEADGATEAFESIVAFDSNTALPHHSPGNSTLSENSIVLFDVGARYHGYCADVTRTFMFKPKTSTEKYKEFLRMYKSVETAHAMAQDMMIEGVEASSIDKKVREYLDNCEGGIYKGKFIHSLGHSVGIDVHDGIVISYKAPGIILKQGMVLTDEPGVYVVGFGGVRIEDDVLVGKKFSTIL